MAENRAKHKRESALEEFAQMWTGQKREFITVTYNAAVLNAILTTLMADLAKMIDKAKQSIGLDIEVLQFVKGQHALIREFAKPLAGTAAIDSLEDGLKNNLVTIGILTQEELDAK